MMIPCITAHFFYSDLEKNISVPIIHIIRETISEIKEKKVKKVGIMATNGTIEAALFQQEILNFLLHSQIYYILSAALPLYCDKSNPSHIPDSFYQENNIQFWCI